MQAQNGGKEAPTVFLKTTHVRTYIAWMETYQPRIRKETKKISIHAVVLEVQSTKVGLLLGLMLGTFAMGLRDTSQVYVSTGKKNG